MYVQVIVLFARPDFPCVMHIRMYIVPSVLRKRCRAWTFYISGNW